MALSAGTIAIDADGNVTGSGLALRFGQKLAATLGSETLGAVGDSVADFLQDMAEAIVEELTENAEVTVTIDPSDSGLQRMSNPLAVDVDTQGPSGTKTLAGTIS